MKKSRVVKMAKKVASNVKIGYKVLVKEGNELLSCTSAGLRVRYVSGKFVYPRMWGGPLTVFESKFLAIGFCEKLVSRTQVDAIRVYRCEYVPTMVEHVWRYRGLALKSKHVNELPEKTELAKKVKILKRVM